MGWRYWVAAGLLCSCATAKAQAPGKDGRTVYEAAYFRQFSPSTALEVVQRVPGFTLEVGDAEVRGFSQAAGNVVINGQRPSSKSDTLQTILARIPASHVARVEVGPGDLFGSEYSGKPQVLNLVMTDGGGLAGTVQASVRRSFTGKLYPEGSASALLKRGPSTFSASAGINNNTTPEEGFDTLRALPDRRLLEYRRKVNIIEDPNGFAAASWEYQGGENRTAHINGRFSLDHFALTQSNHVIPTGGTERDDRLTQRYHTRQFELGGDVTRPLLGGGVKLIGLATRRHRLNRDLLLSGIDAGIIGGFAQDLDDQRDETLARVVWNRSTPHGWSIETGAEGVVNRLKSAVDLYQIAPGGGRTPIDLPIGHATVTEHRGEAFVNAGRALSPSLRLDLGLTFEASRLTVTGDAKAERVLKFLKPKATLDWHPNGGWHAQLSIARTVAQLQFEDFISSAELTADRVNGGNANLLPQRAWELLATIEHPILGDGLVKAELGYDLISLVQDRIPTPEGFDAPGNLGDGHELILRSTLDVPTGRLGITGGRFTAHGTLLLSAVEDPYTHRQRHFTGSSAWVFDAGFRQDLGKFAWSVTLSGNAPTTYFRLDELDKQWGAVPYVSAFAEYRPNANTTVTVGIDNLTGVAGYRDRTFFPPDRHNPVPDLIEHRNRNQHLIPYLTVKHNFG